MPTIDSDSDVDVDGTVVSQSEHDKRAATDRAVHQVLEEPSTHPTLLWRIPANAVSMATGAASMCIRSGAASAGWGLKAGRQAVYGIIGLNQTILETVLRGAGADVSSQSQVARRQQETLYYVDQWLGSLHSALTGASLAAASGFYLAEISLGWASESSLLGLKFLNNIFGSTDTSRAVAALIQLMKQELNKPDATGIDYQIETYEFLTGVATFLFLQRSGKRKTEVEWRNAGGEVPIWDIVIDDRGFRADVIGSRRSDAVNVIQPLVVEKQDGFASITTQVQDQVTANPQAQIVQHPLTPSDEEIKHTVLEQLPPGCKANITSQTMSVKTVKVEIYGAPATNIEAPPGMIMVSEHLNFDNSTGVQCIVFRTATKAESQALLASAVVDGEDEALEMHATAPAPLPQLENGTDSDATVEAPSGPTANQKKLRKSALDSAPTRSPQAHPLPPRRDRQPEQTKPEKVDKPGIIRKAIKSLSPTQSSAGLNRLVPGSSRARSTSGSGPGLLSETLRPLTSARGHTRKPTFDVATAQPTTPLLSPSRATPCADGLGNNYFSVHESRRESTYSQTDLYSLWSNDSRPPSPTLSRTHLRASNSISKTHSHTEISMQQNYEDDLEQGSHHRRSHSYVPSLYSMGTKNSAEDTLVLASKAPVPRKSVFESDEVLATLAQVGHVPGQFPSRHLIWALRRFGRFASAAYGKSFLHWMGMTPDDAVAENSIAKITVEPGMHHEHISFSRYTGLPNETIIKSSYFEPQGIKSRTKEDGFAPIIHIVTVDLEAKAIVMTCRGTLGFEDILTDLDCEYADTSWQGKAYKAHRGIRDSARRLMDSKGGNTLMQDLRNALDEYPEFGLVFVGHSLGGAVAALLAIMLAEPSKHEPGETDAPAFVTAARSRLIPSTAHAATSLDLPPVTLPAGRPMHVYAFGTPACVSEDLRLATRGLITTIINANDIVPYLSLGTLHDFKSIARNMKNGFPGKVNYFKQRVSERILKSFWQFFLQSADADSTSGPPPAHNLAGDALGEDTWMWTELTAMRKSMVSEKLMPPGEIFTLTSTRVFDRAPDETTSSGIEGSRTWNPLGRAATRIQLNYVRDVKERFRELRFGRDMFREHTPWTYENNLSALERGVVEDGF